jgi:hypothetical protein
VWREGTAKDMKVGKSVQKTIDEFEDRDLESCMLHACNAIDGTARKISSANAGSKARYVSFLRDHYWLLEPMVTPGVNLVETRFTNVPLSKQPEPDFAEIVYAVFRCSHGHGAELPTGYELLPSVGTRISRLVLADGVLQLPDRLPFGLIAAAVLNPANHDQAVPDDYFLTLGDEKFIINEWWGRADDFRPIAKRYNKVRVKLDKL